MFGIIEYTIQHIRRNFFSYTSVISQMYTNKFVVNENLNLACHK